MFASFSLRTEFIKSITDAVVASNGTYGCIRDIFESRYLCTGDDVANANVHIKHIELEFKRKEHQEKLVEFNNEKKKLLLKNIKCEKYIDCLTE